MFRFVIEEGLSGNDKTGRIAFEEASAAHRVTEFAMSGARTSPLASLCCRLSRAPDLPPELAFELACRGLALRFVQHPHPSSFGDWPHFTGAIRMHGGAERNAEVTRLVDEIDAALTKMRIPSTAAIADRDGNHRLVMIALATAIGDLQASTGLPDEALSAYAEAIRWAESEGIQCPGVYMRMAAVRRDRGEPDGELADLRAAVLADGTSASAWAWLGRALSARGQTTDAIVALRLAVQAEPESGSYWAWLAEAFGQYGSIEEAAACMVTAADCEPDNRRFRSQLNYYQTVNSAGLAEPYS